MRYIKHIFIISISTILLSLYVSFDNIYYGGKKNADITNYYELTRSDVTKLSLFIILNSISPFELGDKLIKMDKSKSDWDYNYKKSVTNNFKNMSIVEKRKFLQKND